MYIRDGIRQPATAQELRLERILRLMDNDLRHRGKPEFICLWGRRCLCCYKKENEIVLGTENGCFRSCRIAETAITDYQDEAYKYFCKKKEAWTEFEQYGLFQK